MAEERPGGRKKHRGEGKTSHRKIKVARGVGRQRKNIWLGLRIYWEDICSALLCSARTGLPLMLFIFSVAVVVVAAAVASQLPCGANEESMCGMSMSSTG